MDGSEPGEIVAAAVLSGAPVDLQARQVRYVENVFIMVGNGN
jgi:NADH dehydrogenase (ubiquinone) Fe-S protein 4